MTGRASTRSPLPGPCPQIQPVRLWLLSDTRTVLVLAWDASPQPPALTDADDDAESGRGLVLVLAFSERWGTYSTPQTGGKVVWALCSTLQTSPPVPRREAPVPDEPAQPHIVAN